MFRLVTCPSSICYRKLIIKRNNENWIFWGKLIMLLICRVRVCMLRMLLVKVVRLLSLISRLMISYAILLILLNLLICR